MDNTKIWTDDIEVMNFDKDGRYVEILGHRIDKRYESFEAFVEEMASLTKFKKNIEDKTFYDIKGMSAREVYDILVNDLSFYKMIELYRLIKHKMEYLTDDMYDYMARCEEGE